MTETRTPETVARELIEAMDYHWRTASRETVKRDRDFAERLVREVLWLGPRQGELSDATREALNEVAHVTLAACRAELARRDREDAALTARA